MIVVSNTTPILGLYKIERLHLLRDLFNQVWVPTAVYNEITVLGRDKQGYDAVDVAEYIDVKQVQNVLATSLLRPQLDYGEAEAIVLAKELKADILLLDEMKARRVAQASAQNVIGTIGILQIAKNQGLIRNMKSHLDALISNGIWIDRRLYQSVMDSNNE
jgi:predicted nucleic acid-binding protein